MSQKKPFNFNSFAKDMAISLKDISHDEQTHPRFFTAFGVEDLYNLDDRISTVTSPCLIAVDGHEVDTVWNDYEGFHTVTVYTIIVCEPCAISTNPHAVDAAVEHCEVLTNEIRNYMMRQHFEDCDNFKQQGIGPIGENLFGSALTFEVSNYPKGYLRNDNLWNH